MNQARSATERRHVRTSLIASITFILTLLAGGLAGAGSSRPKAGETRAAVPAAAPSTGENGPAAEQGESGCGCAESCLVR